MRDFSLTNLMLVTGTSFLVFTAGMRFLDGTINYFLLYTGLISLGLGFLFLLVSTLFRNWEKKNSTGISTDGE